MVDIITRSPLAFKENMTFEGSAEAAYTTLRGATTPQVNGLFNWKNDAGTFGVMVQGFYEARDIRRDGQEFLGYSTVQPWVCVAASNSCSGNQAALSHPDLIGKAYPTLIGSALFEQQRVRQGGDIAAEWQPNNSFDIKLSGFYSHLSASNINENNMFWGTNEFVTMNNVPTSYTVKNGTIVSAAFPAVAPAYTLPDGTVVAARPTAPFVTDFIQRPGGGAETYYFNADAHWTPTDSLTIGVKGGYSHGVGKTDPQVAWEGEIGMGTGAPGTYDFSKGVAVVTIPGRRHLQSRQSRQRLGLDGGIHRGRQRMVRPGRCRTAGRDRPHHLDQGRRSLCRAYAQERPFITAASPMAARSAATCRPRTIRATLPMRSRFPAC